MCVCIFSNAIIIFIIQTLFPYRLLQHIEYSSLHYTVVPCGYLLPWTGEPGGLQSMGHQGTTQATLHAGTCFVNPNLLIYPSPHLSPLVIINLFSMSVSLFLLWK